MSFQLQNRVSLISKIRPSNSPNKLLQQPHTLNNSDTYQNQFPKKDPIDKFLDDLISKGKKDQWKYS